MRRSLERGYIVRLQKDSLYKDMPPHLKQMLYYVHKTKIEQYIHPNPATQRGRQPNQGAVVWVYLS